MPEPRQQPHGRWGAAGLGADPLPKAWLSPWSNHSWVAPLSGLAVGETAGSLNCPGGFALRLLTLPAGVSQRLRVPVTPTPSSLVPASSGPGPGQSLGTVPARGPRTSWGVSLRCFLGRRGPAGDLGHGRLRALGTQTGCGRGVVLRRPLLRSPRGSRIAPGSAVFCKEPVTHRLCGPHTAAAANSFVFLLTL